MSNVTARMNASTARAALDSATEITRWGDGVGGVPATAADVLAAINERRAEITFFAGGVSSDGTRYAPSVSVLPRPARHRNDPRGSDTRYTFKIRVAA